MTASTDQRSDISIDDISRRDLLPRRIDSAVILFVLSCVCYVGSAAIAIYALGLLVDGKPVMPTLMSAVIALITGAVLGGLSLHLRYMAAIHRRIVARDA